MMSSNQFSFEESSSSNGSFNLPLPHPFHYRHHSTPMMYSYSAPSVLKTNYNSTRNMTESPIMQMDSTSSIRYEICLEAPTAAVHRMDQPPMTYLNKGSLHTLYKQSFSYHEIIGQYYNINLKDKKGYSEDINSTAIITFHDESHRAGATDYWKFWLTHQDDTENAKAIEIDIARSNGIQIIDNGQFDRVTFRWNGAVGASIYIKFNCLSTDFSRIKGVKGIPLRLQIESHQTSSTYIEKTFSRIKLFRDKGAERKNKDDAKHIERQLEKLREKTGESAHPYWFPFTPTSPVTIFKELVPQQEDQDISLEEINRNFLLNNTNHISLPSPALSTSTLGAMKRSYSGSFQPTSMDPSLYNNNTFPAMYDHDYDPVPRRRRIAKLCLLIKFESTDIYRAIYLEELTVKDLTEKILQRSEIKKPVTRVIRKFKQPEKKDIVVSMEDDVVKDMVDDQDLIVRIEENEDKNSLTLVLIF